MARLKLYYEAKPFKINQPWGVHDPKAYAQFGFQDHNGIDIAHGYNSRLRAPFRYQIHKTLWQPAGGGLVLSIVSRETYDGPDGKPANVLIDYLHLSKYVKTQGQGEIGDLLCIAGNTGFSTGPHTHIQPRWVRMRKGQWVDVESNNANNSFNPVPFYCGLYAVDYKAPVLSEVPTPEQTTNTVHSVIEAAQTSLDGIQLQPEPQKSQILDLWKTVLEALSRLLTKG